MSTAMKATGPGHLARQEKSAARQLCSVYQRHKELIPDDLSGETFAIHSEEILVAMDTTGTGHNPRLIDDQPW